MDSLSSFLGKKKSVSKGVLWAVIGAVFMSLDPLFIRSSGVSGYDTVFLFGLYTSVSMAILVQQQEKRTIISVIRRDGWPLVLTSLLMLGSATAFVLSVKKTTVANAFMIQAATPAVAALLGWLLLKEKTKTTTWLAIIGVTIGVGIVVQGSLGSIHWEGDLLALVSVFCVAMIFTVLRKYPEMNRIALVGLGGFLLAVSMFMNAQPATYSWKTWGVMAVMGLLTAPLGRVSGMMATRYIKASEVTLTLMLQNVLAPVLAWYIFDEVPSLSTILGGGLLFSTVLLYTLSLVFRENSTA